MGRNSSDEPAFCLKWRNLGLLDCLDDMRVFALAGVYLRMWDLIRYFQDGEWMLMFRRDMC